MSSSALFGSTTKSSDVSYLYQFKAGKLNLEGNTLTADPRKGWVYLYSNAQKSILHFCWFDRITGMVEDNLLVTDEKASFNKVNQCKDGRVWRLKSGDKRFFIWMQDHDESDDNRIADNVKTHIAQFVRGGDGLSSDLFSNFNKLSQNELFTLLSGVEGLPDTSLLTSGARTGGKSKGKIQLDDLRNIMSSISGAQETVATPQIDFNDVINQANVKDLLVAPKVKEELAEHLPTLPENSPEDNFDAIRGTFSDPLSHIKSSQFRSTVSTFTNALSKGALGPLISQFNLGAKATEAANKGDVRAFAKALEEQFKKQPESGSDKPTDDDKKMDTS